ncbi:MAG: hypothetical protein K0U37_04870 [Gammaproteobacteria bacterium]|nr:hypothetical protein [Gammaproteobacteria bacterium]
MNTFYQLLALIGASLIAWFIYRAIKGSPEQFSRENLKKSFSSMGILALILIVFVGFLVLVARQ